MFVKRDCYAREELHKKRIVTNKGCDWCGQKRISKHKTNPHEYLFEYYIEDDNYRRNEIKGLFCCTSCLNTYHGR